MSDPFFRSVYLTNFPVVDLNPRILSSRTSNFGRIQDYKRIILRSEAGPNVKFLTVITTLSVHVIVQVQLLWSGNARGHSGDSTVPVALFKSPPQLAVLQKRSGDFLMYVLSKFMKSLISKYSFFSFSDAQRGVP